MHHHALENDQWCAQKIASDSDTHSDGYAEPYSLLIFCGCLI